MRQKRKERGRQARAEAEAQVQPGDAEVAGSASDTELEPITETEAVAEELADSVADAVAEAAAEAEEQIEAEAAEAAEMDAVVAAPDGEGDGDPEAEEAVVPSELDEAKLKNLIEALVFASDKPVTVLRLKQLTRIKESARIDAALASLVEDYKDRGIALQSISGGFMFRTQSHFSSWVQQLIAGRPVRLSRAQLETLAIIAYRQPITRPEIDDIRGVDSGGTLKVLLDRNLIRILGKREEAGRPLLYGTTKEFLDFFSLGDLRELPTLREYSELTEEHRKVVDHDFGAEHGADGEDADEASEPAAAAEPAVEPEPEPVAAAEPEAELEPVAEAAASDESAA